MLYIKCTDCVIVRSCRTLFVGCVISSAFPHPRNQYAGDYDYKRSRSSPPLGQDRHWKPFPRVDRPGRKPTTYSRRSHQSQYGNFKQPVMNKRRSPVSGSPLFSSPRQDHIPLQFSHGRVDDLKHHHHHQSSHHHHQDQHTEDIPLRHPITQAEINRLVREAINQLPRPNAKLVPVKRRVVVKHITPNKEASGGKPTSNVLSDTSSVYTAYNDSHSDLNGELYHENEYILNTGGFHGGSAGSSFNSPVPDSHDLLSRDVIRALADSMGLIENNRPHRSPLPIIDDKGNQVDKPLTTEEMLTKLSNEAAASEKGGFVLAGFGGGTTTVTFIPAENGDDAFVVVEEEFEDPNERDIGAALSSLGPSSISSNDQLLTDIHDIQDRNIYGDYLAEEFIPSQRDDGGSTNRQQQILSRSDTVYPYDTHELKPIHTLELQPVTNHQHRVPERTQQYDPIRKNDSYTKRRVEAQDTNGEIDSAYIHDLK